MWCVGWTPFSSGSFSISEEVCSSGRPRVVMIYEDLRPGGMACCLFSLPVIVHLNVVYFLQQLIV